MRKRYAFIIDEICDWGNLNAAFDTVVSGTERKNSSEGRWLLAHRKEFLESVAKEIRSGHIELGKWHPKDIVERGKERHLQVFSMKTRIKVAAVMIVVDRYLRLRFIRTTASSIKGRGVQDLEQRVKRDLREHPELRYWYKFDIKKFYDTVKQDFAKYAFRRVFKDKRLLSILDQFIEVLPDGVGISMGMRSSQGTGNLLLSVFLDHYLKDRYGVKFFYRYCDDGLIGSDTKLDLWEKRGIVHERIELIGQQVKHGDRIFPVGEGVDFLGYVTFPTYTLMRKRVKQGFARKLHKVKSRSRRRELVASFYGIAKHADCLHLMQTLMTAEEYKHYRKKMMKDFGKSKSGQAKNPDGKKSFRGLKVSGRELNHQPFIVLDYETGVIAKEDRERYEALVADVMRNNTPKKTDADGQPVKDGGGCNPAELTALIERIPKPREKYIVSIVFQNQLRKFWTGDKGMWKELDERKAEGGLPFFCSLNADYSGTCPRYELMSATELGFPMPDNNERKRLNAQLNINIPLDDEEQ